MNKRRGNGEYLKLRRKFLSSCRHTMLFILELEKSIETWNFFNEYTNIKLLRFLWHFQQDVRNKDIGKVDGIN